MRIPGLAVAAIALACVVGSLIAVYHIYIAPTHGRYCMLSTGNQGVLVVDSLRSGGNGTLRLIVKNTASYPVVADPRNLSVCLIGSNGRLSCSDYSVNVTRAKILKPGEGVDILVRYEVDRLGVTLAVTMPWAGNHTIYFSRAVRARIYYVIVSWVWPKYGGRGGSYRSLSIVCKNWVGPT